MKTALYLFLISALAAAPAKTFFSHEQALKASFGAKVTTSKHTHYWSKEQRARVAKLVGASKATEVRSHQAAYSANPVQGKVTNTDTAWFDKRVVRTKAQEIMLVVDCNGLVKNLFVCVFDEPTKYKPSEKWYAQYKGLKLTENLQLNKDIHGVSGATLTARSTTSAVRELLAAAQVAREVEAAKKKKVATPQ
jgi:hypothetical protein